MGSERHRGQVGGDGLSGLEENGSRPLDKSLDKLGGRSGTGC